MTTERAVLAGGCSSGMQDLIRKMPGVVSTIHDPTTLNRQGIDRGLSYRSTSDVTSEGQRIVAIDTIKDIEASGMWPGKVFTDVAPADR